MSGQVVHIQKCPTYCQHHDPGSRIEQFRNAVFFLALVLLRMPIRLTAHEYT